VAASHTGAFLREVLAPKATKPTAAARKRAAPRRTTKTTAAAARKRA
jgi:hypothetical protein